MSNPNETPWDKVEMSTVDKERVRLRAEEFMKSLTDAQRLLAIGGYINSALYLTGVFVAGLVTGNGLVWKLALFCAGLNYMTYFAQMAPAVPPPMIWGLVASTAVIGAAAGAFLV